MIPNHEMTTKEKDMAAEKELAKYLDNYLYKKQMEKCKRITRIEDKTKQIEGLDVVIEYENGMQVKIDEKAQLHYMDICLPTFAFEISFIGRDNELHEGWLYHANLKTDTYMLIWPQRSIYHEEIVAIKEKTKQLKRIREILPNIHYQDFEKVECYLIKREAIKEYLAANKWEEQRMKEEARRLREAKQYGKTPIANTNDFYFYFSDFTKYREAPINVVIRKNKLKELAYKKYIVEKTEIS